MKLALVIYLAFCLSMVMTAPRPVGPTLVAFPAVAGLRPCNLRVVPSLPEHLLPDSKLWEPPEF